jgi:hypothetical protein
MCLLFVTLLHVLVKPDESAVAFPFDFLAFPSTSCNQENLHLSICIICHASCKVLSKHHYYIRCIDSPSQLCIRTTPRTCILSEYYHDSDCERD